MHNKNGVYPDLHTVSRLIMATNGNQQRERNRTRLPPAENNSCDATGPSGDVSLTHLAFVNSIPEEVVQQEILEIWVLLESFLYIAEEDTEIGRARSVLPNGDYHKKGRHRGNRFFPRAVTLILSRRLRHKMTNLRAVFIALNIEAEPSRNSILRLDTFRYVR